MKRFAILVVCGLLAGSATGCIRFFFWSGSYQAEFPPLSPPEPTPTP